MAKDERMNGHRPKELLPMLFAAVLSAGGSEASAVENADFELEPVLNAVFHVRAEIPADARTASVLGTEREGNGVLIGDDGLVLTIGYLILEAESVTLRDNNGKRTPAEIVAYDYESGFGLVRALTPLDAEPLRLGISAEVGERDPVLVVGAGGRSQTLGAFVVSRREFAGYWEYLLDEALFTSPPHPNWGGTALIGMDGTLLGVGSLYVENAMTGAETLPGNMFVPIDLLKPILGDMLRIGKADRPPRPWLGLYATEALGRVVVAQTADYGPARKAGLQPGDVIVKIGERHVPDLASLYRQIWSRGEAGADIPITILRGSHSLELSVRSADRQQFLRPPRTY